MAERPMRNGERSPWGRFTARGGDEAEGYICTLVHEVVEVLSFTLDPSSYRAVVMIGGYGKGEGGVESTPQGERPHNNLDLLVITRARSIRSTALKAQLDRALLPLI